MANNRDLQLSERAPLALSISLIRAVGSNRVKLTKRESEIQANSLRARQIQCRLDRAPTIYSMALKLSIATEPSLAHNASHLLCFCLTHILYQTANLCCACSCLGQKRELFEPSSS